MTFHNNVVWLIINLKCVIFSNGVNLIDKKN